MGHIAHTWVSSEVITHDLMNAIETDLASALFAVPDATTAAKGAVQLAGDLTGTAALPTLAPIVTASSSGSATSIPIITWDAKGRITGVTSATASDTTRLAKASNLSDVASVTTARTNLGLATVANTGSYTDLTNKPTIPSAYTDEQAQDAIAAMFAAGTMSGITFTYDDPNNKMNVTVTPGSVADATTTTKGAIQLAGDLAGTAAAPTVPGLASKANTSSLATVATSGSYTDLTNKPASDAIAATASLRTLGTGAQQAASGTDSRFTDTRTPTASSVVNASVSATAAISADKLADGTTNVIMLATERTKLTGIATGATANSSDATLLARANHTGTESADVITDGTTNKAYTATEKTKLAGIATGATAYSDTNARANRLDQFAAPTASVSMGTQKIINQADPTSAQDSATKNYVDSRTPKISVGTSSPVSPAVNDLWVDTN